MTHSAQPHPVTTAALLFGGDWACAHGDVAALAYVASQLSRRVADPFRTQLSELAELCRRDQDLASQRWPLLRRRIAGL